MRRAVTISAVAHREALLAARPGANEHEIEATIDFAFRRLGGTGPAYPSIVASGRNATILHYTENSRELEDGDLLLIDAGAEYDHYCADVTRAYPVAATFSAEQRQVYEIVLAAQKAAIEKVSPGVTFDDVHGVALRVLVEGLCSLGVLSTSVDEAIDKTAYRPFFMHRTSHWLGMDVHDVGKYRLGDKSRVLEPGHGADGRARTLLLRERGRRSGAASRASASASRTTCSSPSTATRSSPLRSPRRSEISSVSPASARGSSLRFVDSLTARGVTNADVVTSFRQVCPKNRRAGRVAAKIAPEIRQLEIGHGVCVGRRMEVARDDQHDARRETMPHQQVGERPGWTGRAHVRGKDTLRVGECRPLDRVSGLGQGWFQRALPRRDRAPRRGVADDASSVGCLAGAESRPTGAICGAVS